MIYQHNGYTITVRETAAKPVAVYDPRYKREPALYRTTSLDLAIRFIDAYRDGQIWATEAALAERASA